MGLSGSMGEGGGGGGEMDFWSEVHGFLANMSTDVMHAHHQTLTSVPF